MTLYKDIRDTLNKHSAENGSDTPDYILAQYLIDCLAAFDNALQKREARHGRAIGTVAQGVGVGTRVRKPSHD